MTYVAPVALFAWRRPEHTLRTITALQRNAVAKDTRLYIFVDGPRSVNDTQLVREVLRIASQADGFASVTIKAAETNQGLSQSLVTGISNVLEKEERVIVLEDDILVAPHFLAFMNEHLNLYADDGRVASIHGAVYPHDQNLPETFFIRGSDCWGWATWRRAWKVFEPDGSRLLNTLRDRGLIDVFDFERSAPFEDMLIDQIEGRNDSWAIRWYASTLLADMLTLYPSCPMAVNIGEDGTGRHGSKRGAPSFQPSLAPIAAKQIPVVESQAGRDAFRRYFRRRYRIPTNKFGRWVWRRARRIRQAMRH